MHGPKSILWIVWLGLILVGIEVRHMHARVLDQAAANIPILFCAIAVAILPFCIWRVKPAGRLTMLCLFGAGVVISIVGLYFHTRFQLKPFVQLLGPEKIAGPQPLPPLALAGLCTIGFIVTRLLRTEAIVAGRATNRSMAGESS
jgi:hypothetical protein